MIRVNIEIVKNKDIVDNPAKKLDSILSPFRAPYRFFTRHAQKPLVERLGIEGRKALAQHHKGIPQRIVQGVQATTGGAGRGFPAIRLVSIRKESDHVGILSRGGTLRSRGKHFTIPFAAAMKDGRKVKTPWDYPEDRTFTITPKRGTLAGKKVMFLKKEVRARRSLGQVLRGERGKVTSREIIPLFRLTKVMTVRGSGWIATAVNRTVGQISPIVQRAVAKERKKSGAT